MKMPGVRPVGPPLGDEPTTRGAGVVNVNDLAAASDPPVALLVPAGTATIGCENVIDSDGAIGTSPSGAQRSTSSVFAASDGAGPAPPPSGGGNAVFTVSPVRGGGCERARSANAFLSSGAAASAATRV